MPASPESPKKKPYSIFRETTTSLLGFTECQVASRFWVTTMYSSLLARLLVTLKISVSPTPLEGYTRELSTSILMTSIWMSQTNRLGKLLFGKKKFVLSWCLPVKLYVLTNPSQNCDFQASRLISLCSRERVYHLDMRI